MKDVIRKDFIFPLILLLKFLLPVNGGQHEVLYESWLYLCAVPNVVHVHRSQVISRVSALHLEGLPLPSVSLGPPGLTLSIGTLV